jgi:hypothetical protein
MNSMRIGIVRDGHAYQIEAPARTKIFYGDRSMWVHFDLVCLDGEMYLARHVLDMARTGENGFRVVGLLPMDQGCPPGVAWIADL